MKISDKICLGTVKLGVPEYGFSSSRTISENIEPGTFLKYVEKTGINRFDTSPRYGNSEILLGNHFSQSRSIFYVSSKIDNLKHNDSKTPSKMLKSVQASLKSLHLKQLYICYLHQNDLEIINDPYVHEGLIELKEREMIRYSGASLYSFEECEYALKSGMFDFIQIPVSVFDVSFYCRFVREKSTSVRFVARSLLLQGILVNRSAIRSRIRQSNKVLTYLNQLDQLAKEYGLSTLEMALAFVFSLPNIDHYLIGTTSIENLEKNIQCLKIELPPQALGRILEIASQPKSWTNPRNWD